MGCVYPVCVIIPNSKELFRLIPKDVRIWRASGLARRQFLEQSLHHTKNEAGVLIFVSEAKHYVEIIADRGVSKQITNEQWQDIVNDFTSKVKAGDILQGFKDCIQACGELLQEKLPATGQKNELANRLVVLD